MIRYGIYIGIGVIAAALLLFGAVQLGAVSYDSTGPIEAETEQNALSQEEVKLPETRKVVLHQPLPEQSKIVYMTSCVAGTPSFREQLVSLIEETELNGVIIDIKDYSGTISFPPSSEAWQPAWENARCGTSDMEAFITSLHEKGIFVIGRITVFQDPFHAVRKPDLAVKRADGVTVWKDHKGLSFIDVAAKEYWDHIIELSVEAYNIGFDELNFDYVRYPSDGPMSDISFTHSQKSQYGNDKQANLEAFFKYLSAALSEEDRFDTVAHKNTGRDKNIPYTSADLFGMTTTNTDDLSIGQILERTAPYFDFVAPMVYPSHYPNDYLGLGNPNHNPYKIVHHAMKSAVDRMKASTTVVSGFQHERVGTSTPAHFTKPVWTADKLRTWIQDFDYGGDYGAAEVRTQIQASYDAGVDSWMIWAPSNIYTRGALEHE